MMFFLELFNRILMTVFVLVLMALVTGNEKFFSEGVPTLLGFMLVGVFIAVIYWQGRFLWYLIKNRDIWERNRRATLLLRKSRRSKLSSAEANQLAQYRKVGVLTFGSDGSFRLSDQAVQQLFS